MKVLGKLAIGLIAMFLFHGPGRCLSPGCLPSAGRTVAKIVKISSKAVGTGAIGAARELDLQDPKFDTDLKNASPVAGLDFAPGLRRARDHTANPGSHHPSPDA